MKKILLIISAAFALTACRLDLQPESSLTYNSFWQSEEAVNSSLTGIYAQFRGQNNLLWRLGEVRSDIWGGRTLESQSDITMFLNDITVPKAPVWNWGGLYSNIHYLNDFIMNAPKVATSNQVRRNHMMGQAHGMRAYLYFTLLKTFGDVPVSTEPLTGVTDVRSLDKPRSPKAEVVKLIKEDIAKSLEYFGNDNSLFGGSNTYWSRPATLALKGEAFIFFGNVLGEGNTTIQEAKTALSQVSGFSLTPTFAGLWGVANERNSEFIFAFDYQLNQSGNFYPGAILGPQKDVGPLFDKFGNPMSKQIFSGGNRYGASEKVINKMYENANDTRGDATFIYLYADSNNRTGYSKFDSNKYRASMLNKFKGEVIDGSRQSFENIPIYRYADVLLMLAEAKNLLGEDPSTEINRIRQRAYGSNAPAFVNGSKDNNTKAILDERLKEFIGEGKRWWDLQRAGSKWVFQEVATMNVAPISGDAKKIYLPITQGMLDADPNLKQTEGY